MPGVLDFLFEGRPPASVTTYGTTTQNLPQWMSDYTQGLITRANSLAGEPYAPYQAPRIAGFTGDQRKAQDNVRDSVGNYKPAFEQAGALTQTAGATDITGAAQPYMDQAAKTLPGNIQSYMDPYVGGVIDRAALVANRNYNENVAPALSNQFTSSGQYGSTAHMREAARAGRELTEGLQSTSLGALSQAYQQAGTQFQGDQTRQAQLAGLSGDLASKQGNLQLDAAKNAGALGEATQSAGLRDTAALAASGAEQQQMGQRNLDLAYQDFQNQQNYPKEQVGWLSEIIRGMPHSTSGTTTSTGPADNYGPSGLSQIGSILTAGKGIYDILKEAKGGRIKAPKSRGALSLALS